MIKRKTHTTTTILSLLLSSICLFLLFNGGLKGNITANELINITSSITTGLSFLVGCYFALLAVSAYAHFREIEKVNKDVNTLYQDSKIHLDAHKDSLEKLLKEAKIDIETMASMIEDMINIEIAVTDSYDPVIRSQAPKLTDHLSLKRISLMKIRSLLALKYDIYESERRASLIRELFVFGKKEDLPALKSAATEPKNKEYKDLIEAIIVKIAS